MIYRKLGRTGWPVSAIGLGCEHLEGQDAASVRAVIDAAVDSGVNIMDVFMSEPNVRSDIGAALAGRRDKVYLQGHIGSIWENGQYRRSRSRAQNEKFFKDFTKRLRTDYVDIGMIHYVDTMDDYKAVFDTDIIEYVMKLKRDGDIRCIGLSSHDPVIALKCVETGLIDVLLFSINPMFDLLPDINNFDDMFSGETYKSEGIGGIHKVRERLYQTCETIGTAITVMKGYAGGMLLSAERSPFGKELTCSQCIHYALSRPAVSSILVGARSSAEVAQSMEYLTASDEEKDYMAALSGVKEFISKGKCMYCNHCLPCPSRINIAQVNKFYDLATLKDNIPETVREHYLQLGAHASDCIECASCEENCPFEVQVIEKMHAAAELFGV